MSKLYQELLDAHEAARLSKQQASSVALTQIYDVAPMVFLPADISKEVQEVSLQVDHSKSVVDDALSFVGSLFEKFSIMSERLMGLKSVASQNRVQFESIICGHNKVQSYMINKMDELDMEKNLLQNQLVDQRKKIEELKCDLVNWEMAMADQCTQHELEKGEILGQVLNLQKEVSSLSTSALAREKENMRKELDKVKLKFKDTESKLKNTMQEKTKLESEKMQSDREIKRLIAQRDIIDRDIRKCDSRIDRRQSKLFDPTNQKGHIGIQEQNRVDHWCPQAETLTTCSKSMRGRFTRLYEKLTIRTTRLLKNSDTSHLKGPRHPQKFKIPDKPVNRIHV